MAIDTADKRYSLIGAASKMARVFPVPDGSYANAQDRAHLAWLYAGTLTSVSNAARLVDPRPRLHSKMGSPLAW